LSKNALRLCPQKFIASGSS